MCDFESSWLKLRAFLPVVNRFRAAASGQEPQALSGRFRAISTQKCICCIQTVARKRCLLAWSWERQRRSICTQQYILLGTAPFYPATSVAGYGDVVPSNSNAAARSCLRAEVRVVRQRPQQRKLPVHYQLYSSKKLKPLNPTVVRGGLHPSLPLLAAPF